MFAPFRMKHKTRARQKLCHEEPGQDSRHVDSISPQWNLFDFTPEGRGTDWYPELSYS
jgi:predicted dithiol-disulfide oxidoreductase (DUF899 family)